MATIVCPNCQNKFPNVPDNMLGRKVKCSKCGESFQTAPSEPLAGQTLTAVCPSCQAVFSNIPPSFAGKNVRCRKCRNSFRVEPTATGGRVETDAAVEWTIGETIANLYEVSGVLGEGGMGTVYKVRHLGWDLDLAVKCPKPSLLARAGGAENFEREAETWVQLGLHPHTVSCYYVRRLGGIPRVFAEFVAGGSLTDWIKDGRLYQGTPEEAIRRMLDVAIQFAWGLDYAHEQGLIHQDVKPGNVMVTTDGLVKVTDFGLSRAQPMGTAPAGMDDSGANDPTGTIMVAKTGMTPAYASPEQAVGKKLTRRTDLWSWGVSLVEMFTGEVTWPMGSVVLGALEGYLESGPENESIPMMPEGLVKLLKACFVEDPDKRPHDMDEVARELIGLYQQVTGEPYNRSKPTAGRDQADSLNNRAVSLLDLGRREEALKQWAQALKADPHHLEATFNLGLFEWKNRSLPDNEVYRRMEALAGGTDDGRHLRLMGRLSYFLADYARAAEYLKKRAESGDVSVETLRDLGLALAALASASADNEPWHEVLDVFGQALDKGFEDPSVAAGKALALTRLKLVQDAEKYYRQAVGRHEQLPDSIQEAAELFIPGQMVRASTGHPVQILNLALSSDSGRVAAAEKRRFLTWTLGPEGFIPDKEIKLRDVEIRVLTFSRDLRLALAEGGDARLHLWNLETGERLVRTKPANGYRIGLALSEDGKTALAGGSDRAVIHWDLETGDRLNFFEGHEMFVAAVAYVPGKNQALSGGGDMHLRLWSLETGNPLGILEGHRGPVTAIDVGPTGRYALSAGEDKAVLMWDLTTGDVVRTLTGHTEPVRLVKFVAGGKQAVSMGDDRTVRLWDLASGRIEGIWRFQRPTDSIWVRPDGKEAVMSSSGGLSRSETVLSLWKLEDTGQDRVPYVVTRPVSALEADALTTEFLRYLETARKHLDNEEYQEALEALNKARAVTGFERHTEVLDLWSNLVGRFPKKKLMAAWELGTLTGHREAVLAVAVLPDGSGILSGSRDGTVRLWDVAGQKEIKSLEGHRGPVVAVALDGSGKKAVSGGWDKTVRLWDLESGETLKVFEGHEDVLTSVDICGDGRFVLSAARDGTVRLWDCSGGVEYKRLSGPEQYISSVAFSPDGRLALAGGLDKSLYLWDLTSEKLLQCLDGHDEYIRAVAAGPDGIMALTGGDDRTLRRWHLPSAENRLVMKGRQSRITSVAVSPDGRFALSGGEDKTLCLWDLHNGDLLSTIEGHTDQVADVAFGPEGTWAASAGLDRTVRIWHLDWEPDIRAIRRWDEGARPYLELFLTRHTPYAAPLPSRRGRLQGLEEDRPALTEELNRRGFGWLDPEGVEAELNKMASVWSAPPAIESRYKTKLPEKKWYLHPALLFPLKYWKFTLGVIFIFLVVMAVRSAMQFGSSGGPTTFYNAKLFMAPSELKNIKFVKDENLDGRKISVYQADKGNFMYADVPLADVVYKFEDSKLVSITLVPSSSDLVNYMLGTLVKKYGRPRERFHQETEQMVYSWNWGKTRLRYVVEMSNGNSYAEFYYKESD